MNFNVGYAATRLHATATSAPSSRTPVHSSTRLFPFHRLQRRLSSSTTRAAAATNTSARSRSLPHRGDPVGSRTNLFSPESDWITYHTVVSTSDRSDRARARLSAAGRGSRTDATITSTTWAMSICRTSYSYVSARYDVKREVYPGVGRPHQHRGLSAPAHPYDVDDMIASSKAGLAYYEKNFSPFQFASSASSSSPVTATLRSRSPTLFPTAEPGFIGRVAQSQKDIDHTYFVTAHELAHQWWGHQLIGGRVEGSNMMSEALAEYSALRVMQKKYGDNQMHKFLKHELDGYLRGRAGESRHEPPLVLVQREAYVWYQKGSLVLYASLRLHR